MSAVKKYEEEMQRQMTQEEYDPSILAKLAIEASEEEKNKGEQERWLYWSQIAEGHAKYSNMS